MKCLPDPVIVTEPPPRYLFRPRLCKHRTNGIPLLRMRTEAQQPHKLVPHPVICIITIVVIPCGQLKKNFEL